LTASSELSGRGPRLWWDSLARRRRRQLLTLGAASLLLVLVVGVLLARFLQLDNVERDDELALVQAEAKGEARAMIAQLSGCERSAACVANVKRIAADPKVHRSGAVKILSATAPTANSPGDSTGKTRFAWTVIGKLPVVQCIEVHRSGNPIEGITVTLLSLSAPIPNEADC
jgi:hypothetical protein